MERTIQLVQPMKLAERKLLRVAAYARVSCDKDAMKHSLAAQISYYNEYIQRRSDWAFAGIYADEAYRYRLTPPFCTFASSQSTCASSLSSFHRECPIFHARLYMRPTFCEGFVLPWRKAFSGSCTPSGMKNSSVTRSCSPCSSSCIFLAALHCRYQRFPGEIAVSSSCAISEPICRRAAQQPLW